MLKVFTCITSWGLTHSQEYIFDLYFIDKEIKTQRREVTWPGTLAVSGKLALEIQLF